MICFRQLKHGAVARASGLDPEGEDFRHYCNDSVRQLMNRGNFWSTVHPVNACVRDGVVTWPRGTAAILALNNCGRPALLSNQWYQFMQPDSHHRSMAEEYMRHGHSWSAMVETANLSCCFNPIKAEGFTLRFFPSQTSDVGRTITVYGVGVNGQTIRTMRGDGTFQDGVVVSLALPFGETPFPIRHATRIAKEETNGDVNAFQWNVAGQFLLDFAQYQPTEINPQYITTVTYGTHRHASQVSALVKMNFIPFKYDNDLVQIDSEDAIRDMLLAIRKKEQGDVTGSFDYETSAIRELNHQMKSLYPDEQFIVNFRPFGSDDLNNSRIRIGQI